MYSHSFPNQEKHGPQDPRDHAPDRKQRRLHLALIFECTFHWLIARVLSYFFSQPFCLI